MSKKVQCPLCEKTVPALVKDGNKNKMCKDCYKELHTNPTTVIGSWPGYPIYIREVPVWQDLPYRITWGSVTNPDTTVQWTYTEC